jgi:hypothetical protein
MSSEEDQGRSRRPQALALGAAILVVAAVAGFLIGREARADPKQPRAVRSGPFALEVPATWRERSRQVAIPGLILRGRVDLAPPAAEAKGTLVVGVARADDGSLLPATLVPHPRPSRAVRLANLQALRYDGLRPLDFEGPIDVYAAPTPHGVLTAVCAGTDPGFLRACRAAVATLRLPRGKSYALGPDRALHDAVGGLLRDLNEVRDSRASAMERARRPQAQAAAATAVARAYKAGVRRAEQASRNPASAEARAWLADSLDKAAAAWGALASAAGAGDDVGYRFARLRVAFSESWVGMAAARAGRSATVPAAPPSRAPAPAAPVAGSRSCSDTHPFYPPFPDGWHGFVQVCANRDGTSLLVTNTSGFVIAVEHDGRPGKVTVPHASLGDVITAGYAQGACAGPLCRLYQGASVRIDGERPVNVRFSNAFDDTLMVGVARLAAGKLESRFMPKPARTARQFLDCAKGVIDTYEGGESWEERFRKAGPPALGCSTLADAFRRTDPQDVPQRPRVPLTDPINITVGTKNPTLAADPALLRGTRLAKTPTLTKSALLARELLKPYVIDFTLGLKVLAKVG